MTRIAALESDLRAWQDRWRGLKSIVDIPTQLVMQNLVQRFPTTARVPPFRAGMTGLPKRGETVTGPGGGPYRVRKSPMGGEGR